MEQEQNAIKELKTFWNSLTKSEKVTWLFNCVGFIASLITLVELARVRVILPEQPSIVLFTPGLALGLWSICCFTYIIFLHAYWQRTQKQNKYDAAFRNFILIDLLYCFRLPVLLFPLLLLILGLYAIMAIGNSPITAGLFSLLLIFALSCALYIKYEIGDTLISERVEVSDEFKMDVDQDWTNWEKRVAVELGRRQWVHPANFSDVAATKGLSTQEIRYILATYALKHPETTKFGDLLERPYAFSTPQLKVAGVLVNLETIQYPFSVR